MTRDASHPSEERPFETRPSSEADPAEGRSSGTGKTALVVIVPEAETVVGLGRARLDCSADGFPAHVTVLYPFIGDDRIDDRVLEELRDLFAAHVPFDVHFTRCGRFADLLYLVPEPEGPFRRLTDEVVTRWPEAPPYGGQFEPVPHLTVADGTDIGMFDAIEADVLERLPVATRADAISLVVFDGSGWRERAVFRLGGG
ncbi:2'-5' RNA ligase family protein [Streptosporangium carneum]|uniref:2'-5' RNA ligase n=1 Tax=Streptosporangium carneum TaxID=47481 RepID=A0A9W6I0F7_9ACTN|nr:2'-5' RNA ligase family protein [Streptosporangium carneum]GLK08984.1 hypothetical protein GCM10017600_23900 [Streptosporangium carneum]